MKWAQEIKDEVEEILGRERGWKKGGDSGDWGRGMGRGFEWWRTEDGRSE